MPPMPLREGYAFTRSELISVKHIYHDGDFIGTIHITSNLDVFYRQLKRSIVAVVLIIVACSALALFVALRMLRVIAQPIEGLIDTASRVSQSRDYSLRAVKFADDDMGSLTDEFNDMLQQIQQRDEELEQRVTERTAELQDSLDEKVVLLEEVHHRVKNNLQIIASLLNLQANQIRDPEALRAFANSENRVRAMAAIHEQLYLAKDLGKIDFTVYVQSLIERLFASYNVNPQNITLRTEVEEVSLDIDQAIPLGLVMNELVSNSLKYAFPNAESGEIHIRLVSTEEGYCLSVRDNGVGFPRDIDFRTTRSLGLQLIRALVVQLHGRIDMHNHQGTEFRIGFPGKIA